MVTGTVVLMPVMVTALDVVTEPMATLVCAEKLNASGVVIAARVVTSNVEDTVPTVTVAVVLVLKLADAVCFSARVSPFLSTPGTLVNAAPLILNSPPTMVTGTVVLMPLMVTVLERTTAEMAVLFSATKLNGSGVVRAARVVTSNPVENAPMVTVVVVLVLNDDDAVWRRTILSPACT